MSLLALDTVAANYEDLVRILVARGFDMGNVSASLKGLEVKGLDDDHPDAWRAGRSSGPDPRGEKPHARSPWCGRRAALSRPCCRWQSGQMGRCYCITWASSTLTRWGLP